MITRKFTRICFESGKRTHYLLKGVRVEFMEAWISSRALPLVSGTNLSTNTTVRPQMLAKMKNVPASISKFHRSENLQRK
jgi:hypothetical protein